MPVDIPRGGSDDVIDQLADALRAYESDHPGARISIYRRNQVSVRVRVIDASFAGHGVSARHGRTWRYIETAPEEAQSDISQLVLVTPDEADTSPANREFEDPTLMPLPAGF